MVNQYIWVGIAVGVFFAGLGIGIAVLQPSNQPSMGQGMMGGMMMVPDIDIL